MEACVVPLASAASLSLVSVVPRASSCLALDSFSPPMALAMASSLSLSGTLCVLMRPMRRSSFSCVVLAVLVMASEICLSFSASVPPRVSMALVILAASSSCLRRCLPMASARMSSLPSRLSVWALMALSMAASFVSSVLLTSPRTEMMEASLVA